MIEEEEKKKKNIISPFSKGKLPCIFGRQFHHFLLCSAQYQSDIGAQMWPLGGNNVAGEYRYVAVFFQVPLNLPYVTDRISTKLFPLQN